MSEPRWFPGPWSVSVASLRGHQSYVIRADDTVVARTALINEPAKAAAHLIAAAPELYAALQTILAEVKLGELMQKKVRVALAMARGEIQ